MSFIPSSAGGITNITSTSGSGVVVATSFGSSELSSALVAGSNVTLTPSSAFGGKGLRIDTSPGIAGVTSVTAGTGIALTGTAANPIVNNAGVLGVTANPGILVGGTASNPVLTNDGVTTLNTQKGAMTLASAGGTISITNPTPGTINLEQSGGGGTLTGITAGTGIAVSGSAPTPTVSNTGTLAVYGGIGIVIAGPDSGPTVNNTGVLSVNSGFGVAVRPAYPPNTQTLFVDYVPDQAVVSNPAFTTMDPANNGFVDGRGAPLNAILIQHPGTYYLRATTYGPGGSDLQAWALLQTGTAPASGAFVTPSCGLYTIFNANPVGTNNITNLNFSYLRDNNFSPGLTSPLAGAVQLSPNQSVTFSVSYLPQQGAGGSAADTTRPVITWINKNQVAGVPA